MREEAEHIITAIRSRLVDNAGPFVVALDGASGVGKSTLAAVLAGGARSKGGPYRRLLRLTRDRRRVGRVHGCPESESGHRLAAAPSTASVVRPRGPYGSRIAI